VACVLGVVVECAVIAGSQWIEVPDLQVHQRAVVHVRVLEEVEYVRRQSRSQ